MLRLSCQLPWFCPRSWSWSWSWSCPWFTPLPWKLPFVQYMFACTFASVQFATDCRTISLSSIGSYHAMQWASWACATTLPLIHADTLSEECPFGSHRCPSAASHPMSLATNFSNWYWAKPFVNTSANCSVVFTFCTLISSLQWLQKKWYLTVICFMQKVTLCAASANLIVPVLSSHDYWLLTKW